MNGVVFLGGVFTGEFEDDFGTARVFIEEIGDLTMFSQRCHIGI